MPLSVMMYRSVLDTTGKKATYPDFNSFTADLQLLSNSPEALAKPQYPYDRAEELKLSWDTNGLFGPFEIKKEGNRLQENIKSIEIIVLDIDNPESAFDLIRMVEGKGPDTPLTTYNCIIYHTLRSKPTAPKLRLLMELDPRSSFPVVDVKHLLNAVARELNVTVDKQTKHGNRIHFLPIYPHGHPDDAPRVIWRNAKGGAYRYDIAKDPLFAGERTVSAIPTGLKYVTKDLEYTKGVDAAKAAFFFSKPAYSLSPEDLEMVENTVTAYEKGTHPRLKFLRAEDGRAEWLEIAYALHHGFGGAEEGFDYWTRISKCDPDRYKDSTPHKGNDPRSIWESIEDERPGGITFATFLKKYRVPVSFDSPAIRVLVQELMGVERLADLVGNADDLLKRVVAIQESGVKALVIDEFINGKEKKHSITKSEFNAQLKRVAKDIKEAADPPEKTERQHHNVLALLYEAIPRLSGLVYVGDKGLFYDIRANSKRPDPNRASTVLWMTPEALASSIINAIRGTPMAAIFAHDEYTDRAGTSIVDERFLKTFLVQKLPTVHTSGFIPYESQIFTNAHGDSTLNLFHSSLIAKPLARALTEKEKIAKDIMEGFVEMLLSDEPNYTDIYWEWVYDAAYSLETRNPYILLVHGMAEGTGKSVLRRLAINLVTMRYAGPTTGETLYEDKFNASIFDQRLINAVEEIHVPANCRAAYTANVKHMMEDTVESHKKFENKVTVDNFTAFFMTSNASDAIPIGMADRRHAVLRLSKQLSDYQEAGDEVLERAGRLVPGNIYANMFHILESGTYYEVFATLVHEKHAARPAEWNSRDPVWIETKAKTIMRKKTLDKEAIVIRCIQLAFTEGRLRNIPLVRQVDVVRVLMNDYGQDVDLGFDDNQMSNFNRKIGKYFSDVPAGIMYDHESGERYRVEVECPWERRPTYTKVYGNLCIKSVAYFEELYEDKEALRNALQVSLKSLHQSMENEAGIHAVPTEQALPPKAEKRKFESKFLSKGKGDDEWI